MHSVYLVFLFVNLAFANKAIDFLQRYGYLDENAQTENITSAVILFQETFNLTVDGTLNTETLDLMSKPRCGNKDELFPFSALPTSKWNTNVITWYMYGSPHVSVLIERAFTLWAKHANLTFIKQRTDPTILLSMGDTRHFCYKTRNYCPNIFDGPGGTLAHAYIPDMKMNQTEVHFDNSENWDFSMNLPTNNKMSFYLVALHEVGHALGLYHSPLYNSIMHAAYSVPFGIPDLYAYDLHKDDILSIQYLYGFPATTPRFTPTTSTTSTTTTTSTATPTTSTTPATTTTSTAPPTTSTSTTPSTTIVDVCSVRNQSNRYLVFKEKLYVMNNKLVWTLSLDQSLRTFEEYKRPQLITDWLTFLPSNFTSITAVYQRPNDEIVIIVDETVYFVQTPSLQQIQRLHIKDFVRRPVSKVNAAVSTNQGKIFIITDNQFVFTISDCAQKGSLHGGISATFPGVPNTVEGSFRYINGKLYFQIGIKLLEFDEFNGVVTRTIDDTFDLLGISCVRESLLAKLYQLIKHIN